MAKNSLRTNIVIDVCMLLSMAMVSFSGWVLHVMMPARGGFRGGRGHFNHLDYLGMEGCTWREIHLWAGVLLLALLVAHVMLHWRIVSAFFEKKVPNRLARFALYALLLVAMSVTIIPWIFAMF